MASRSRLIFSESCWINKIEFSETSKQHFSHCVKCGTAGKVNFHKSIKSEGRSSGWMERLDLAYRGGRSHLFHIRGPDEQKWGSYSVIGVKVRKMTHSESGPLIGHWNDKGQGLWSSRANVIYPTFLETPNRCALIGGHKPSTASMYRRNKS